LQAFEQRSCESSLGGGLTAYRLYCPIRTPYPLSIGSAASSAHSPIEPLQSLRSSKTELMQQKQIDGCRYAAAAIDDRVPVRANASRRKFRRGIVERSEGLGLGIDQARRRHIDAPRNAPRPAITARLHTEVELRAERVDSDEIQLAAGGKHRLFVDKPPGPRRGDKARRRIPLADPVSTGRPPARRLSKLSSSTAASSKPSAFSIHQKRVAHIIVPML
jgi:hypothetical protein